VIPPSLFRFLSNLLIGLGGSLAALLILEMGARLLPPPYGQATDVAHICSRTLGWRGKPNYEGAINAGEYQHRLRHNSAGMHDTEHQQPKPPETYRISMLGDSFTWAAQVKETETAHQVLEDLLNKPRRPDKVEVISAAITGWSTGQQLIYYRTEGRFYQPDLVLLMFYIGNDVFGNLPGEGRTLDGHNCFAPYFPLCRGQLDTRPWYYVPGVKPAQNGECSSTQRWLSTTLEKLYYSSELYAHIEPLFTARRPHSSQIPYYPLYIPAEHEQFDYAWQVTIATIKQLHQEVKQDGAAFAVVLISPADVIHLARMDPGQLEQIYQKVPDLRQAQPNLPHQSLSAALSEEAIPVLDLQPLFIEHIRQTGEALYFPGDKHWNVAGNRLAAEAIAAFIASQ
jgi:hypothetical protein